MCGIYLRRQNMNKKKKITIVVLVFAVIASLTMVSNHYCLAHPGLGYQATTTSETIFKAEQNDEAYPCLKGMIENAFKGCTVTRDGKTVTVVQAKKYTTKTEGTNKPSAMANRRLKYSGLLIATSGGRIGTVKWSGGGNSPEMYVASSFDHLSRGMFKENIYDYGKTEKGIEKLIGVTMNEY